MKIHEGDLLVTTENLDYAATVTEVTGHVFIHADLSGLPSLTKVGKSVGVHGNRTVFPALTEVGDMVSIEPDVLGVEFPALARIGGTLAIAGGVYGAKFPVLAYAGSANIRSADVHIPALTEVANYFSFSIRGNGPHDLTKLLNQQSKG